MLFNLCLQDYWDILHFAATIVTLCEVKGQSPFATDLFFLYRSTGSKQTLNGLFLFIADYRMKLDFTDVNQFSFTAFFQSSFLPKTSGLRDED